MTEQDKIKLAEWLGFKWSFFEPRSYGAEKYRFEHGFWMTPDNKPYEQLLPDFHSLDACLKWIRPKVHELEFSIYLHIGRILTTCIIEPYHYKPRKSEQAQDKEPATAFCEAVLKLIEGWKPPKEARVKHDQ